MNDEERFIADFAASLRERKREKIGKQLAAQNSYDAGNISRLTADWPTQIYSPTSILRLGLRTMRARARQLDINNDYARKFHWMCGMNIGGPEGVKLQNKSMRLVPDDKNPGKLKQILDKSANDKIEEGFSEWCKKGNFDVTGQIDGPQADFLVTRTTARDGEMLVRMLEGFDNDWGFALQFIEADYLDEYLNVAQLPNGNSIRMGKEFDKWFRPVAYHLLADHPGDGMWTYNRQRYQRVPADHIIHCFMPDRINQPRGVPWTHSAMTRLNNIGAYEEAEIIGSRIGASTMGIWERDEDADPNVNPGETTKAADDTPVMEMEPGIFAKAPRGYHFKPFDPNRPAGNFAPFMKAALRGVSSGMLVSYNSLANDLEGVNYSSLRAGALEERDSWKVMQAWFIQTYKRPIFERWLKMALLTQKVFLPASRYEYFNKPKFSPRVWAWVDPLKDLEAVEVELNNQLTSRSDVCADRGEDYEETLIKLQEEKKLREQYGIPDPVAATPKGPGAPAKTEPGNSDETQKQTQEALAAMTQAMTAMTELIKDFKNSSAKVPE